MPGTGHGRQPSQPRRQAIVNSILLQQAAFIQYFHLEAHDRAI
jgi:hypothetical protein